MKKIQWLIVIPTILLAACSSGPYASKTDEPSPVAYGGGNQVLLADKDLRRTLTVENVTYTRDSLGRLQVQANVRNRTNDEKLSIQIQTAYFDKAGRVLYSNSGNSLPWENFVLTPNQSMIYNQTALTSEAAEYRIQIRYTTNRKPED